MLGLDAAGKTTILYKLHIGEVLSTVPTIGGFYSINSIIKYIVSFCLSVLKRSKYICTCTYLLVNDNKAVLAYAC